MLRVVHDDERPPGRGSGWVRVSTTRRDVGLIELVAALVGEPGAEVPSGVHPTLAAAGKAVSDLSSWRGRRELRPLALSFPGTAHTGLTTPARLAERCTSAALDSPGELSEREVRRLEAARRLARFLLGDREEVPRGLARWWLPSTRLLRLDEPLYRCLGASARVSEAVGIVARACGPDRDRRLRTLLVQCLAEVPKGNATSGSEYRMQFPDTSASPTRHGTSGPVGLEPTTYGMQSTGRPRPLESVAGRQGSSRQPKHLCDGGPEHGQGS